MTILSTAQPTSRSRVGQRPMSKAGTVKYRQAKNSQPHQPQPKTAQAPIEPTPQQPTPQPPQEHMRPEDFAHLRDTYEARRKLYTTQWRDNDPLYGKQEPE